MKADIGAGGLLTLTPETPMEEWALKCWSEKAYDRQSATFRGGMMIVQLKFTELPTQGDYRA